MQTRHLHAVFLTARSAGPETTGEPAVCSVLPMLLLKDFLIM